MSNSKQPHQMIELFGTNDTLPELPTPSDHGYDQHAAQIGFYVGMAKGLQVAGAVSIFHAHQETLREQELHKAAADLANRDPLTSVGNRRLLEETFSDIQRREYGVSDSPHNRRGDTIKLPQTSSGNPYCLLVLDVDDFKDVNTASTHVGGDEHLVRIARAMQEVTRPKDKVARIGGDEFAALLPDATLEEAAIIAERLRASVEKITTVNGVNIKSSASIGYGQLDLTKSFTENLRPIDTALFQAKDLGRNKVVRALISGDDPRQILPPNSN